MNIVMDFGGLDEIRSRLDGCSALLYLIYENAGASTTSEDAIRAVLELLDGIRKDFKADIDTAKVVSA